MTIGSVANVELELMRLSHAFAFYMDYRRYEDLIGLFLPDAMFDRVLQVHHGHDEIRAGLNARPTGHITRHVSTNFHFDHVSDDEAKGVVYNLSHTGSLSPDGEAPGVFDGPGLFLDFHDVYRRTLQGWRFAERIARPVLLAEGSPMLRDGRSWRFEDYM